jgi:hypothetical protein
MKSKNDKILPLALALIALALSFSVIQPAKGAAFLPTGALNIAREDHTATLLPNGKVLVAGGHDINYDPLSNAEIYDPTTGKWTATGRLTTARFNHTATLLPNGKVLVVGGNDKNYNPLSSAEIYDPGTGTWVGTGALIDASYNHTATLLPSSLLKKGCF